jgi:Flp pilus assembly protein TadG
VNVVVHAARRARHEESGVVLVLVAILLTVLLAFAALAIDLGSLDQAQKQAQAAADAGALAAADDLEVSANSVTSDAQTYAAKNYPGSTSTVTTPNARTVQVTVNKTVATPLANIFGNSSSKVSATATAGTVGSEGNGTIFAMDANCSDAGITMDGTTSGGGTTSGLNITGLNGTSAAIDSNGALNISNYANSSFGDVTYGKGCTPNVSNNTNSTFSSGPVARSQTITSWPVDYSYLTTSSSACTYHSTGGLDLEDQTSVQFYPGVYCYDQPVVIKNDTYFGPSSGPGTPVTLIAPSIDIEGISYVNVLPYIGNDLLMDATSGTCTVQANIVSGATVFVPNGTLNISDSTSLNFTGYLEAQDVVLDRDGNDTFTGNGPKTAGTAVLQQ